MFNKIRSNWFFIFLFQTLILTTIFAGPKEECAEAGGVYQESGLCTCKDVPFTPSDFFCKEDGLIERRIAHSRQTIAPPDDRLWNPKIWQSRNLRPFDATTIEPFIKYSADDVKVMYFKEDPGKLTIKYEIQYYRRGEENGFIKILHAFRGSSEIAPFQMQYTLLRVLAKKMNRQLPIKNIEIDSIVNLSTVDALAIDFPQKGYVFTRADNFQEMEFFKSPLGSNSLDLIKKMQPDKDPFSLISEITILRIGPTPNVIIELNTGIKIDPFIRIFEYDLEVANVPAFSKQGKMHKIGNLIWSIPSPWAEEVKEMTQQEAIIYCKSLGEGVRLAKIAELDMLAEQLGSVTEYNPNLLDGISNNFWSQITSTKGHYIFEGAKGIIEKVDPTFKAYPMCVLPSS